jgi:hypothetical protein
MSLNVGNGIRRIATIGLVIGSIMDAVASPPIIEDREYRGRKIMCVRSGLMGFSRSCGASEGYAQVFVGTVLSVVETPNNEFEIELMPEEVFRGDRRIRVSAKTNQGRCLPELKIGDKWLFYLQNDEKSGNVLLAFGGPSAPVKESEEELVTLRRVSAMVRGGILKGSVSRQKRDEQGTWYVPIANHRIIAKRVPDGKEQTVSTDVKGRYEFSSLPAGEYELSANTTEGLWASSGTVMISSQSCTDVGFALRTDGRISGRVTTEAGEPARYALVAAVSSNGETTSGSADEQGNFEIRGLEPGSYRVGVDLGVSNKPLSPAYYPGVVEQDAATLIEIETGQSRTGIDFPIPSR